MDTRGPDDGVECLVEQCLARLVVRHRLGATESDDLGRPVAVPDRVVLLRVGGVEGGSQMLDYLDAEALTDDVDLGR